MDAEFIHPNWHVILIHYPLGLLAVGVAIEILSFFWRRSTVRQAGRWMILIGALSAIPALTLGLYAYRDVVTDRPIEDLSTWRQVTQQSHWNAAQWEHMNTHLWLEAAGTGIAVLGAFIWLAGSDRARQRLYWPALVLVVAGLGFMSAGAWYAGEGVYRHAVAVQTGEKSSPPARSPALPPTTAPATQPDDGGPVALAAMEEGSGGGGEPEHAHAHAQTAGPRGITYYIPPLQLHALLAGATVAIALGAFGVTIRRWAMLRAAVPVPGSSDAAASVEVPDYRLRPDAGSRPPADPRPGAVQLPAIFPARVWLWALVFAIGTALSGVWFTGDWQLEALTQGLTSELARDRLFGHVVFGSSLTLLLLLGALFTRVAPRHRAITVLIMLLAVVVVAGQVWLGILLLFDSVQGPVTGFN